MGFLEGVLFVYNSLHFCLQRYFFLDRGILKYSKCQADVSDLKPFKTYRITTLAKITIPCSQQWEVVSAVLNSRLKGGK